MTNPEIHPPGPVRLMVCTTCREAGVSSDDPARPGARLHEALSRRLAEDPALAYVYGDLDPEASVDTILAGIGLYAGTHDGIVPWRERPQEFKKGVVARIPPIKTGSDR